MWLKSIIFAYGYGIYYNGESQNCGQRYRDTLYYICEWLTAFACASERMESLKLLLCRRWRAVNLLRSSLEWATKRRSASVMPSVYISLARSGWLLDSLSRMVSHGKTYAFRESREKSSFSATPFPAWMINVSAPLSMCTSTSGATVCVCARAASPLTFKTNAVKCVENLVN